MGFIKTLIKKNDFFYQIYCSLVNLLTCKKVLRGKNRVLCKGSTLRGTKILIYGEHNSVVIGERCDLRNCKILIKGNHNYIVIGDECYFKTATIWLEDSYGEVRIGKQTTIQGNVFLACIEGTKLRIGDDCMLSSDIVLQTGDAHSVTNTDGARINYSQDIVVSNHVWIGTGSILMKGSMISNNSIVGAKSVVTKKFDEENVAVAGNPAKVIKRNINWKRERI